MKIGDGNLAASPFLMSDPPFPLAESLGRYSWVEFVAEEPQPAKIMFSHWWGGLNRSGDLHKVVGSCCWV